MLICCRLSVQVFENLAAQREKERVELKKELSEWASIPHSGREGDVMDDNQQVSCTSFPITCVSVARVSQEFGCHLRLDVGNLSFALGAGLSCGKRSSTGSTASK